jgi:hypothetical protein
MGHSLDLDDVISVFEGMRGKKDREQIEEALSRKFSLSELSQAYRDASPEEREEFRQLFGGTPAQVVSEEPAKPREVPKPKRKRETAPPEPKNTREGRKSGRPYTWDVDEGGQVISLDVARIYSGPDEDEEVEIPDAPEPEPEDEEVA